MNKYELLHGDCLDSLKKIADNSIDSVVTDPPYGISFMGAKWDYSVPSQAIWGECLRVLKPGGHLLSFASTRTQHRMAVCIEDVGFEIRDMLSWVYSSGYPHGKNLGSGFHSALKPAVEPITMARKPFIGSLSENFSVNGTGGLNIDGCRVPVEKLDGALDAVDLTDLGRFPSNLIHDGSDEVLSFFPDSKGQHGINRGSEEIKKSKNGIYGAMKRSGFRISRNETGKNASRFFYCPKTQKKDRHSGMDGEETNNHPTVKPGDLMQYLVRLVTPPGGIVLDPFNGSGSTGKAAIREGFRYIGCELSEKYIEISRKRIDFEVDQIENSLWNA